MACEEKARLLSDYETAAKKFSDAVTDLQKKWAHLRSPNTNGSIAQRTKRG
jgi:hypothetical protein